MSIHGERVIYSYEPWVYILPEKLSDHGDPWSGLLLTRVGFFEKTILRILGFELLKYRGDLVVVGYVDQGEGGRYITLIELNNEDWFNIYSHKLPGFIALPLSEVHRVLLYVLIGISGVFINLGTAVYVYKAIIEFTGALAYPIASTMGFETSVFSNFTLHELITFRGVKLGRDKSSVFKRLLKYHAASIASWITQVSLATILPIALGLAFWISQLTGIIMGFIVNFILGYIYTWSIHRIGKR